MHKNKLILTMSFALGTLVIAVSLVGLYLPGFYTTETVNWQVQTMGQDIVNLFLIVPCMLVSAILTYSNNRIAAIVWGGCVLYLAYTFTLYCFDIHFNRLFIVYCLCLGLSAYASMYFIIMEYKKQVSPDSRKNVVSRYIGAYFIIIAILFYMLWLREIVPANLKNDIPESLKETGLFTNGVHVLDLSILLPALLITGISLLKGRKTGHLLTPILVVFFLLMSITIAVLQLLMKVKGLTSGLGVMYIMLSLAGISLILLLLFFRDSKPVITT